jgi:hypothetical protein
MKQERLSIEQMTLKYPDQWLFITDCEISENTELLSGVVTIHSPSKYKVNRASAAYKGNAAIRYTGKTPEGMVFLL